MKLATNLIFVLLVYFPLQLLFLHTWGRAWGRAVLFSWVAKYRKDVLKAGHIRATKGFRTILEGILSLVGSGFIMRYSK